MKMACVLNSFFPHYLDHLVPLCYYCKCPLIVDDPDILALAKKYYPQIETIFLKINVIIAAKEYNLLIFTSTSPPIEMMAMAKYLNIKTLRFAYTPHGFSDKPDFSKRLMNHELQDIALVHGPEQMRQLKQYKIDQQVNGLIQIGNPRLHFYKEHQAFFDAFVKPLKTNKKSILFAPTYHDGFSQSSFSQTQNIIEALEKKYQLIIKLHPLLEKQNPIDIIKLKALIKGKPNVHLMINEPLIHPFIEHSDAYLGDFSSIGYEFAFAKKPVFLFASKKKRILDPYAHIISSINELDPILKNKNTENHNLKTLENAIFPLVDPKTIKRMLLDSLK